MNDVAFFEGKRIDLTKWPTMYMKKRGGTRCPWPNGVCDLHFKEILFKEEWVGNMRRNKWDGNIVMLVAIILGYKELSRRIETLLV